LGNAVSSFIARDTNGYRLIAAFDINPDLVGREMSGVTIRPLEELESFCREYKPDRKSTRLNSSHVSISYAVFCLKKKKYTNTKNSRLSRRTKRVWKVNRASQISVHVLYVCP